MPVAAGQAAHAVQPEVLRDGSLLFRFASGPEIANGCATDDHGHDAAATSQESTEHNQDVTHNGHANSSAAASANGHSSSRNGTAHGAGDASSLIDGGTSPSDRSAARGGGGRTARGSADARQHAAHPREGAGGQAESVQRSALAQQHASAAVASSATAAEPRPSFMDIPPPQQQYRTRTMTAPLLNGSDSEEDDGPGDANSRSGWSGKRRPQRVRTKCLSSYAVLHPYPRPEPPSGWQASGEMFGVSVPTCRLALCRIWREPASLCFLSVMTSLCHYPCRSLHSAYCVRCSIP